MEQTFLPTPSPKNIIAVEVERLALQIIRAEADPCHEWNPATAHVISLMGGINEVISYLAALTLYFVDGDAEHISSLQRGGGHNPAEAARLWLTEQLEIADLGCLAPLIQKGLTDDEVYDLATFRTLSTS